MYGEPSRIPSLRRYLALAALLLPLLLTSCAKDIAPPGGPPDTTPPLILSSTPQSGSTNVNIQDEIVIEFTERINAKTVPNALFISPPLRVEPRVRVSGSRVRIAPESPLDSGRTYVVTLGSSVSDLNGNKLANSLTLAFSTGAQLDSGIVTGRVFDKEKPASNFRVFAYSQRPFLTDSLFNISPTYITESGSDGQFKFDFIREGEYLIMGVEDKDRDNKISVESERVAIPIATAMAVPAEIVPEALALHVTRYDSAYVSLVNCSGYAGHVLVLLSGPVDPASVSRDSITITTADSATYHPDAAIAFDKEADRVHIWSTHFIEDTIVSLTVLGLRSRDDKNFDPAGTSCVIRVRGKDDQAPELIDRVNKGSGIAVYPHDSLKLAFNEPVNFPAEAISITIDSLSTSAARVAAADNNRYAIFPDSSIYDRRLKARVNLKSITDLYGNHPKDSLYEFNFTIANPDSIGNVAGSIEFRGSPSITIKINGIARKIEYTHVQAAPGPYSLKLYPDQYTVTAFADQNSNGRWDHGALYPFRFAEPGWIIPDTLRVRARFDTEGYDLELK